MPRICSYNFDNFRLIYHVGVELKNFALKVALFDYLFVL